LTTHWQKNIGLAIVDRLTDLDAFVLCLAVSSQHLHLLLKTRPGEVRPMMGKAKRHAWFIARDAGWTGKLWAKRGWAKFVRDKQHHINVFRYILNHQYEGAFTWVHPDVHQQHPTP
jgi:hypothetical protein